MSTRRCWRRIWKNWNASSRLARADEAQAALERQSLDLHDELQRVAGYFEGLAEERDLT